jgi:hypothetical protein
MLRADHAQPLLRALAAHERCRLRNVCRAWNVDLLQPTLWSDLLLTHECVLRLHRAQLRGALSRRALARAAAVRSVAHGWRQSAAQLRRWLPMRRILPRRWRFTGELRREDARGLCRALRVIAALRADGLRVRARLAPTGDLVIHATRAQLLRARPQPPAPRVRSVDVYVLMVQRHFRCSRNVPPELFMLAFTAVLGMDPPQPSRRAQAAARRLVSAHAGMQPQLVDGGWFVVFAGNPEWAVDPLRRRHF